MTDTQHWDPSAIAPLTGMLPRVRTARLIGPISGLQLGAGLAAVILPVPFLVAFGGRGLLLLPAIWTLCAVTAYRREGRNGWWWLSFTVHAARRHDPARAVWTQAPSTPAAARKKDVPKPGQSLFAAAPGRLVGARLSAVAGHGDGFVVPQHATAKRRRTTTIAWEITGPPFDTASIAAENTATTAWAGALDALSRLDGLVAITLHCDSAPEYRADRTPSETVAGREYGLLLGTVAQQPAQRVVIAVTWKSDEEAVAGVNETIVILHRAGMTLLRSITATDVLERTRDLSEIELVPASPLPRRTAVPAYRDHAGSTEWLDTDAASVVVVATSSLPVSVDGHVLEDLFSAPASTTRVRAAIVLRPIPKQRAQASARARRTKLRRTVASSDANLFSGMLIDSFEAEAELETLNELSARGARGQAEYEAIVYASLTSPDMATAKAAAGTLTRAIPALLFQRVAFPGPVAVAIALPIGVLA